MKAATRVLFVCVHNSARSQMAEGMLRAWGGDRFEGHSAGTQARGVRPEAIAAMREIGIDIGAQRSKTLDVYAGQAWDVLIPVCEEANEACPYVPGARTVEHWAFDDPSDGEMDDFRRVRDEIAVALRDFIGRCDAAGAT
jgi:arsenate reductase